jgi:hypothetical protein
VTPSILLWFGLLGCGSTTIAIRALEQSEGALNNKTAYPLFAAAAAFTLLLNVLTTGTDQMLLVERITNYYPALMVYKIWQVDRQTAIGRRVPNRDSPLHRAMRITIDSAALYTVTLLIFTCAYAAQSHVSWIVGDSVSGSRPCRASVAYFAPHS